MLEIKTNESEAAAKLLFAEWEAAETTQSTA